MTFPEIAAEEKLCQFIKEYADDHCCLELLQFFGGHLNTRFNGLAVVHGLMDMNGNRRRYIERAVRYLMDKGVVRTYIENNVPLYSLTEDESLRSLASDLAKLDWRQWQLVLSSTTQSNRCGMKQPYDSTHTKASETHFINFGRASFSVAEFM